MRFYLTPVLVWAALSVSLPLSAEPASDTPLSKEALLKELQALQQRMQQLEQHIHQLEDAERIQAVPVPVTEPVTPATAEPPAAIAQAGDTLVEDEVPVTAGYDKNAVNGFFIRDESGQFQLNIGAYTQARYSMNKRDGEPAHHDSLTRGGAMNRTRIFFEGKYTDQFNYHFRTNIDDSGDFDLIAAYLTYNINPHWSVRLGEQFLALSREDWMYAQDVLGMEFSPNDFTFGLGSSIGAQAHYQDEDYRYWFGVSNGAFGGKKDVGFSDQADVMFNARYEYQIGDDWSVWDDLVGRRGRAQGVLLGLAGSYQYDNKDNGNQPDNSSEVIADVSFNGNGYQAMLSGTWLWVDPKNGGDFSNYGLMAQGGYFFTDRFQLYSRYDLISPGNKNGNLDTFNAVAAGINYFPFLRTNRWKFTGELAYLFETMDKTIVAPSDSLNWLAASKSGQTSLRFQAQFGF